jgi:hypothetical protein
VVTRLNSPRLVTDSMSSGGEPHESYGMSSPGSTPISPMPQPLEVLDLADVAIPGGRDPVIPNQPGRSGSGRFTAAEPAESGGWTQVKGLSR